MLANIVKKLYSNTFLNRQKLRINLRIIFKRAYTYYTYLYISGAQQDQGNIWVEGISG